MPAGGPPLRVAAVSYLNARPLVLGLRQRLGAAVDVRLEVPARLPALLASGEADIALLPVAAFAQLPAARTVGSFGIAADGPVASVALFSEVPMAEIDAVLLDPQSCTSVALVRLLMDGWWQRRVRWLPAGEDHIDRIGGRTAGVIIGDRAMVQGPRFAHRWDLAQAWRDWTGLPFVFAAWASLRPLPDAAVEAFDAANAHGLTLFDAVAQAHPAAGYDVAHYLRTRLQFRIDARMHAGMALFLQKLATSPPAPP